MLRFPSVALKVSFPSSMEIRTPARAVLLPLVAIDLDAMAILEDNSSFSTENFKLSL